MTGTQESYHGLLSDRLDRCRSNSLEHINDFLTTPGQVSRHNNFIEEIVTRFKPTLSSGLDFTRLKLPDDAHDLLYVHPVQMNFNANCQFIRLSGRNIQFNPNVFAFIPDAVAEKLAIHEIGHLLINRQGEDYARHDRNTNHAVELTCDALSDAVYPDVPMANALKYVEICRTFMDAKLVGKVTNYVAPTYRRFHAEPDKLFQGSTAHPATMTRYRQSMQLTTKLSGEFAQDARLCCDPFAALARGNQPSPQ